MFTTSPLPGNRWSWTLSSYFADMFSRAEVRYGPAVFGHSFLGIEFGPFPNQHLWYFNNNQNHVMIRLTDACVNDIEYAIFQLGQEVTHLLSPSGNANTTILDEGIATEFGLAFYASSGYTKWNITNPRYLNALGLYQQLLAIDPSIIRHVRQTQPRIPLITAQNLLDTNPSIPQQLAVDITQQF